jgi:hypothetical protein
MKSLHPYCAKVLPTLAEKYPWEQPFIQAANEVFASIGMVLEQDPLYQHENILARIVEIDDPDGIRGEKIHDRSWQRLMGE